MVTCMGIMHHGLCRSESILEFSHLVNLALRHPDAFDALGREADAETVKYFECLLI